MLALIKNTTNGKLLEKHVLDIPDCCPVSHNPRPGSQIIISYYPVGQSLEIGSLIAYLHSFQGGLKGENGEIVVRDMEDMIKRIIEDCTKLLNIPVKIEAHLLLLPKQEMVLSNAD